MEVRNTCGSINGDAEDESDEDLRRRGLPEFGGDGEDLSMSGMYLENMDAFRVSMPGCIDARRRWASVSTVWSGELVASGYIDTRRDCALRSGTECSTGANEPRRPESPPKRSDWRFDVDASGGGKTEFRLRGPGVDPERDCDCDGTPLRAASASLTLADLRWSSAPGRGVAVAGAVHEMWRAAELSDRLVWGGGGNSE